MKLSLFFYKTNYPGRALKEFSEGVPASCKLLSSHHHWSSAPPSPWAPPRRPMPPNLNSIECESGFRWNADGGGILHTPCFDKELVHCFLFPALRKVTTDKGICGCFQSSGRMTNIIVFQKVQYLKRGAAPRPLAPPARRIRPPLAPLPRAGAGGSPADTDSRAPGRIESNKVMEEVSFSITTEE